MAKTCDIDVESTLTSRYQTTVPATVRRVLRLDKSSKIRYRIQPNGEVIISNAAPAFEDDPLLSQFLEFLAHDLEGQPERIQAIDAAFVQRATALVSNRDIDLDSPLSDEDE